MNLQLSLKTNWFEMTEEKIKKEDYRDITPYWCNRLLLLNGETKSKDWWYYNFFQGRSIQKTIISLKGNTTFKPFKTNTMTKGYPKKTDTDKILKIQHNGIQIRTGTPKWGAELNKIYFVIKHGGFLNEAHTKLEEVQFYCGAVEAGNEICESQCIGCDGFQRDYEQ